MRLHIHFQKLGFKMSHYSPFSTRRLLSVDAAEHEMTPVVLSFLKPWMSVTSDVVRCILRPMDDDHEFNELKLGVALLVAISDGKGGCTLCSPLACNPCASGSSIVNQIIDCKTLVHFWLQRIQPRQESYVLDRVQQ